MPAGISHARRNTEGLLAIAPTEPQFRLEESFSRVVHLPAGITLSVVNRALVLQEPGRRRSALEAVRRAARIANRLTFRVDNGVVDLIGLGGGVLAVNEIPRLGGDPVKAIRAAALSGWTLVQQPSDRTVELLAQRVSDRYPVT